MGFAFALDPDDVDYFELPEKKVPLNLRVPTSLKASLQSMEKIWQLFAEARGAKQEEIDSIDVTHVSSRYLRRGVEADMSRFLKMAGMESPPTTEEGWAEFKAALIRAVEAEASSTPKK